MTTSYACADPDRELTHLTPVSIFAPYTAGRRARSVSAKVALWLLSTLGHGFRVSGPTNLRIPLELAFQDRS